MEIQRIIETSVYVNDLQQTEVFYGDVLGLKVIGREAGRHVFFQVGANSVLLAFDPKVTLRGDQLPPHGAMGPGHVAFGVEKESMDAWKRRLEDHGIAIEQQIQWPRGGTSFYFRDPAGNSIELITPGLWGLPGGW